MWLDWINCDARWQGVWLGASVGNASGCFIFHLSTSLDIENMLNLTKFVKAAFKNHSNYRLAFKVGWQNFWQECFPLDVSWWEYTVEHCRAQRLSIVSHPHQGTHQKFIWALRVRCRGAPIQTEMGNTILRRACGWHNKILQDPTLRGVIDIRWRFHCHHWTGKRFWKLWSKVSIWATCWLHF